MFFKGIDILIKENVSSSTLLEALSQTFVLNISDIEIVSSFEEISIGKKMSCVKINRLGTYSILLKIDGNIEVKLFNSNIDLIQNIGIIIQSKILFPIKESNPFLFWELDCEKITQVSFDEDSIKPEKEIDGAKVIELAWSGEKPFGFIPVEGTTCQIAVYGLAICKYNNSEKYYRFSCDKNWNVENDMDYDSINDAKEKIPVQNDVREIKWEIA